MKLLFDTSAILKRYREEPGRERVASLLAAATDVVLADHCKVEIAAGLCQDLQDAAISPQQYAQVMAQVHTDFEDFAVARLDARAQALAIAAMETHRLCALEALHIGAAQAAAVDLFVTADPQQALAARAVGLKTELIET